MVRRGHTTRFRVRTKWSGISREVTVRVYDNVEDLRDDAFRFAVRGDGEAKGRGPEAADSDMVGVFQGLFGISYVSGKEEKQSNVGIIRLWKGRLGTGVISHEVTHAALAIYEADVMDKNPHNCPWESMENEEIMCHLVGSLMAKVTNGLYNHGCFGTSPRYGRHTKKGKK